MKYYNALQIWGEFHKFTPEKQISTLHSALGYMEQSNTRSQIMCIALAMGYKNTMGESTTFFKS